MTILIFFVFFAVSLIRWLNAPILLDKSSQLEKMQLIILSCNLPCFPYGRIDFVFWKTDHKTLGSWRIDLNGGDVYFCPIHQERIVLQKNHFDTEYGQVQMGWCNKCVSKIGIWKAYDWDSFQKSIDYVKNAAQNNDETKRE